MSKQFTGKNSYSLVKTNPKLTGNIKVVVDSNDNIYLESIDADKTLSLNKYKAKKTNERRSYSADVYDFFNNGSVPSSLVYKLAQNSNFYNISKVYADQYYTPYTQGAYPKISKEYKEQLSYFAPIWLETNDIPELFVIFKLPDPVSIKSNTTESSYDDSVEKQIYNPDYFNGDTSNYFFETILKNSKIHKVFDLGEDSTLGKYIRNHVQDPNFPEAPVTVKYNLNEYSTFNGISLNKSGFTEVPEDSFTNAFVSDSTITEYDNHITNAFSRNNVISANIMNFEFLFDDETSEDYEVSRYFGFYVNEEVISKFLLDGSDFYSKRNQNFEQNKNIKTPTSVSITDQSNITLQNSNGVKLFINGLTDYNLLSDDVKAQNYIPYIKGTNNKLYDINTNTDWGTDEIILKDTLVETKDFKGYTDESIGVIPAELSGVSSRSYVEFTINGQLDNVEIRIRKVDEYDTNYSKNQTFISDEALDAGTFNSNKFSAVGTSEEIAKALTDCINAYTLTDESFAVSCTLIGNKAIVNSRIQNDYANTYEWLIFSNDNNEPPITVNFGDLEYISVAEYNTEFRTPSTLFKDYDNLGGTGVAQDDAFILQSNFIGGRNSELSRIKVPAEFFTYFNDSRYLKTKDWYSKIKGIYRYTDEPEINGRIITEYNNYFEYITVDIEDDSTISTSDGGYCYIYDLKPNDVGLLSMYPIKQFDVDQFRSVYGKDGDGYINLLEEYAIAKGGTAGLPDDLQNEIKNFQETGFATLIGNINEETNELPKIDNEYDRLKENELSQLAISGRIIPFINKWVYDNDAKDVRENPYRLNTSIGFGYSSFAPSEFHKNDDPRYFTHEWYYLQKFPPYITDEDRVDTFSYFEDFISYDDITNVTEDKFKDYFIQEQVSPSVQIPRRIKYSIFANGNDVSYASAVFRGAKLLIKKRNENEINLNYNIKNIVTYADNYFNGYKFAAVLTNDTDRPISYNIVENKKFKTITFFIQANLDDYYLTLDNFGDRYLDRSALYILKDKYEDAGGSIEIADVALAGAFAPFSESNQKTWSISGDGAYIIPAFQNLTDGSLPGLNAQVLPNEQGSYNRIEIQTVRGIIAIDQILEVNRDFIKAKKFEYSTNGGNTFSPFNDIFLNIYPTYDQAAIEIPIYMDGGFNAFNDIIQSLSYSSIFDKVNNGDPSINYISISEDSDGNEIETRNEFLVEFVKLDINAKANYLTDEVFISNAIKSNDYKPIGSKLISLNKTYLTPLARIKGNFSPKVDDIIVFKDDNDLRFTEEIRNQILDTNVQFFSNYPGFAEYKQLYINKVNIDNPLTVLELTGDTQIRPEWWKIGEVAIDKKDQYIFRSNWDHNYYQKYTTKTNFISYPGYVEPKETPSMLASTVMNIPDQQNLEKFTNVNIDNILPSETPNIELIYELFIGNDANQKIYKIKGTLFTQTKAINQMSPDLDELFNEYVNPKFNFNDLTTMSDDKSRYIIQNIMPRYDSIDVVTYAKFSSVNDNELIIENKYTEQELIQNGFSIIQDVIITGIKENDYDKKFEYVLPRDKNVTLAFIIKIKST